MKFVGLLSGGKDSCFNLCHCVAQGHELVALASLGPEGGKEEIDSYLYQTVGQDGLHFIAQAMNMPLFRRTIIGTAVDQAGDYAASTRARLQGSVDGDETEDLFRLLQDVLAVHPDIKGVSVGAILSNYQRVRVEHVCARLGLQSLSYLWQYDQTELLEDMDTAGMESVIIKVAGAGLGQRHLGKNVCSSEMRDELERLKAKWGTHPAGEGGEYETYTVDCPLFKKRINLTETEAVVLSSGSSRDDIGTIAYLRLKAATLEDKPSTIDTEGRALTIPPLLDSSAERIPKVLLSRDKACQTKEEGQVGGRRHSQPTRLRPSVARRGNWLGVSELTSQAETPENQMRECFDSLTTLLQEYDLALTDVSHINLYLSSMDLFPRINAVYNTFFGPSPPTRACVGAILPEGMHVKMGVIAYMDKTSNDRTALHVRGLSYWAPANIGPYSQAVKVGERLFIAGQIGLEPPTLSLPSPPSFASEAALSSQHVQRIVKAMQEGTGGGYTGWMESCICWLSGPSSTFAAKRDAAREAWSMWGKKDVPFLIIQTTELPRGAMMEWQVTWQTGRTAREVHGGDGDDEDDEDPERITSAGSDLSCSWSSMSSGRSAVTILAVPEVHTASERLELTKASFSVRAFYKAESDPETVLESVKKLLSGTPAVTLVPVLNIASSSSDSLDSALVAFQQQTEV